MDGNKKLLNDNFKELLLNKNCDNQLDLKSASVVRLISYLDYKGIKDLGNKSIKELNNKATSLYAEELIKEFDDEVYIDFCEDCEKWDGINDRCSCGNRMVCWEVDGNFLDNNIFVYPQPY